MPSVQPPTTVEPRSLSQLLDEAFNSPRVRPEPARRCQLDFALRVELHRLLPLVQGQADRIDRGTRAWYSRDKALGDARDALSTGLSPSSLAACIKLTALARIVRTLDEYAGGEQ
jgi:hypothetical protein